MHTARAQHISAEDGLHCPLQIRHLGGVYMRKLAPARVSYRDDFLISYRVYMMTGSFHIAFT